MTTPPPPTPNDNAPLAAEMVSAASAPEPSSAAPVPRRRNGGYWALAVMCVLFVCLGFFGADKDAGDEGRPLVDMIAWGFGALLAIVALLFARTSLWGRLGLGLLATMLTGGWAKALDYHSVVQAFSLIPLLAVTLVAALGMIRPRSWTDRQYRNQLIIVRALCVVLLVCSGFVIARLTQRVVAHEEAEFEYLFLGMLEQFDHSIKPTFALVATYQHDDTLTTTAKIQRATPLVQKQLDLTENLQARVEGLEAPRKYRKVKDSYVQLLGVTAESSRSTLEAMQAGDEDLVALVLHNMETKVMPAMRIYHAELRAAGIDVSEDLVEESVERALLQYY